MDGLRFGINISLGVMFVLAGAGKLLRHDFAARVTAYRLLPAVVSSVVAFILPWLELLTGVALLIGVAVRGAAALAVALLFAFAGAMTVNLLRGRRVACGCGFDPATTISWWLVGRNLALAALGSLMIFGNGSYGVASLFMGARNVRSELTPALVTTGCAWLLVALFRQIPQLTRGVTRDQLNASDGVR